MAGRHERVHSRLPMLDKMKSMIWKFAVIFGGLVDLVLIGNAFLGIQRRTIWPALPYPVPISPNNAFWNFAAHDRTKEAERDAPLEGGFQVTTFQREVAERAFVGLLETYLLHWLAGFWQPPDRASRSSPLSLN
jgi:hypothetical protein